MKWEQYRQMTKAQREEYTYRFGDKPVWSSGIGFAAIALMGAVTMAALVLAIWNTPGAEGLKEISLDLLVKSRSILEVGIFVFIAVHVEYVIRSIIYEVKRQSWLKKRGLDKWTVIHWRGRG